MPGIFDRYLLREVAWNWLAVTGVLLAILLSNQFARVLGKAASGDLPRDAVFALMGLTSVQHLTILIPLGLFLAIILALGRFYSDSEMAALSACGVGPPRLYFPLMLLALPLAALVAWIALVVAPWAANGAHVLQRTAQRDAQFSALEAGRFHSSPDGDFVFYAENSDGDGLLGNIFIQYRDGERVEVAVAARGEQRREAEHFMLVLFDGQRYEGAPGAAEFRIIEFAEHGIPVPLEEPDLVTSRREIRTTPELLGSAEPEDVAEFHWRLAAPLSVFVLTLLAVPLGRIRPRQGRYGRFAIAILVYVTYANLLGAGKVWLERGAVPASVGMFWVHALLAAIGIVLLFTQIGWPRLRMRRATQAAT